MNCSISFSPETISIPSTQWPIRRDLKLDGSAAGITPKNRFSGAGEAFAGIQQGGLQIGRVSTRDYSPMTYPEECEL